jgi:hypothetical protein
VSAATFDALHRYAGVMLQHGERSEDEVLPAQLQPRDVALIYDVWRYRFASSDQLQELHWPRAGVRHGQRRLSRLFAGGHLERVRPHARRGEGSYPWIYYLGAAGHRALVDAGYLERRGSYWRPRVWDYSRIAHDVEVNGWVLALRRELGEALRAWRGEREAAVRPSKLARQGQLQLLDNWTPTGLRGGARQVRPDALLEVALANGKTARLFVEHDRTERPDKNIDKFERYDNFLTWWGREGGASTGAFAVFVCATEDALAAFVEVADQVLTGHLQHPGAAQNELVYTGRKRTLFALERDVHEGRFEALRLPAFPPLHPSRRDEHKPARVMLPGASAHAGRQAA